MSGVNCCVERFIAGNRNEAPLNFHSKRKLFHHGQARSERKSVLSMFTDLLCLRGLYLGFLLDNAKTTAFSIHLLPTFMKLSLSPQG